MDVGWSERRPKSRWRGGRNLTRKTVSVRAFETLQYFRGFNNSQAAVDGRQFYFRIKPLFKSVHSIHLRCIFALKIYTTVKKSLRREKNTLEMSLFF